MWKNQNLHTLLVRMSNTGATFINSLAVPFKLKHVITRWPDNSTPTYTSKRWKLMSNKALYSNVYRSILHNGQRCKQLKCPSTYEWVNEIWSSSKKSTDKCYNINKLWKHYVKWKSVSHKRLSGGTARVWNLF